MRDLTIGSMLGYKNQNSGRSPVERMMCSYAQKHRYKFFLLKDIV
jgi:hypothetical protein